MNNLKKKLQIRQINDFQGNSYKIYDILRKDKFGRWTGKETYFTLEEALRFHSDIYIEDTTKENEND